MLRSGSMAELNDKRIIVTGASSGIGRATAIGLARTGALIVATGRHKTRLRSLQKSIAASGGHCLVYALNLSNYNEIKSFINFTKKKIRAVDWLINSAGHIAQKETPPSAELTMKVNLLAPYYLIRLLLPLFRDQGGIINISSTASLHGNASFPIYSASKAALNTLSTALARRTPPSPACFTICPGPTHTPMREKLSDDAHRQQSPEYISRCIEKIISQKSSYVNGDIIVIKNKKEELFSRIND